MKPRACTHISQAHHRGADFLAQRNPYLEDVHQTEPFCKFLPSPYHCGSSCYGDVHSLFHMMPLCVHVSVHVCMCVGVSVSVCALVRVPELVCGGQRTALWLLFYSSTFFWVPGTELRSPPLLGERFYLLNHLSIPVSFSFKTVQKVYPGLVQTR